MESIPTLDMESEDLRELSDDARRLALGERILAALRGIGFVYLLNHDLPESLRSSVFQTGLRFFDLPLETKLKYHRFVRAGANGYMPPAEEDLSRSETADGAVHELKESWDMRTPDGGLPTADAPQFGADVSALMPALSALSLRVLGALEVALSRPGLFSTAHRRTAGGCQRVHAARRALPSGAGGGAGRRRALRHPLGLGQRHAATTGPVRRPGGAEPRWPLGARRRPCPAPCCSMSAT
ncbi:Leucoanthocyanidin dioxygenase [Amphibalanus amphitrite]|uniref:Leucoanthocyanidin dioxygenase n=1 Tax=Amphibalanus amphitrite TaxID=1232801 RepID=A0A6A4XFA1_AMPAM|nr:Leucoanthocyanidin dioxygenase [Amphibalanus amphitrite]